MATSCKLTVVMITDRTYEVCRRSISYLLKQTARKDVELIVVGTSIDEIAADHSELEQFGAYQVIGIEKIRSTGHGLSEGIARATTP